MNVSTICTLSVPCTEGTRTCPAHAAGTYNVILERTDRAQAPRLLASEVTWSEANDWRNALQEAFDAGVATGSVAIVAVDYARYGVRA